MLPHKPGEWPALFEKHIEAGDVEAAAALYDPNANFVSPRSGDTISDRDAIRAVLGGLIESKARLHATVA